jgi:hypothetical protein
METFFAALVSAGSAVIVCLITNAMQSSATRKLLEYRLNQLEEKVDKHNNIIERTYALEKAVAVLKERIEREDDHK